MHSSCWVFWKILTLLGTGNYSRSEIFFWQLCGGFSAQFVLLHVIAVFLRYLHILFFRYSWWYYSNIVDAAQLYLQQPLCVVLHDALQLFQPLSRLVVHRSIFLNWVVVVVGLAVVLLWQQKCIAAWAVLDLILSLSSSTVSQAKAET